MTPLEARYAAESRSSADLAACFLHEGWDTEAGLHAVQTLHHRGGRTEFELGRHYAASADASGRAAGADILAQLGCGQEPFQDECVALLISLLHDSDAWVIRSAAMALGHRKDARAIPALLAHLRHPEADVRRGIVDGLSGLDHPEAIAGLIELSRDPDDSIRDWATFGLGRQTDVDTPALRDALAARLTDPDPEVRGEALIGLAERKDDRVRPALEVELRGPFQSDLPLEAVRLLAGPEWIPLLENQRQSLSPHDALSYDSTFETTLAACRQAPG